MMNETLFFDIISINVQYLLIHVLFDNLKLF